VKAIALVIFVLLGGCSSSTPAAKSGSGRTGAAGTGAGGKCPVNGTVPPSLRDVERDAEGVSYAAFGEYPTRTANWDRADAVLSLLEGVWKSTKTDCPKLPAGAAAAVDKALRGLHTAIPAKDQQAAALAGNDVHVQMAPLFAYFKPEVPNAVVRMDAIFLRAGIDAHFGDWSSFGKHLDSLKADWSTLRSQSDAKVPTCHRVAGTSSVVTDIDDTLAAMQSAATSQDASAAEMQADAGLLEVDIIELLFDCPPDGVKPRSGTGSSCTTDASCGSGEVCDRQQQGGRCAPDPATTNVGMPCNTTIDCGNDPRDACNNEAGDGFPGGYCSMEPCDDIQVCSPGATCVARPFETPACMQSCNTDADCRTSEGYVCQLFPTVPPGGYGPSGHACSFPCGKDEDCTTPLKCAVQSGKCTP
jgi:hypothetical protein